MLHSALMYGNTDVRVVLKDGEPWFVAKDVCAVLRISKYRDAVARLDEEDTCPVLVDTNRGARSATAVNESGLYILIFASRRPEAKAFKRWVTSEVLPAIRKYGQYAAPEYERQKQAQAIIDRWNHEYTHEWVPKLFVLKAGDTE